MEIVDIVSLFGGIAMFLFGMSLMGDSLKKAAGNRLKMILNKLTGNAIKGILLGTGVTAVIQSSSATSVMVVGFVNSGMMKVKQAIGIILGAILGTSITGWILCLNSLSGSGASIASLFSTEMLTGIVAFIGIIIWMTAKRSATKNIGGIMLGFAVLMYGMSMMSGSLSGLKENEVFINTLTSFSNPMLGVLVGIAVTAVLQSASAAIGILQALSMSGAITFGEAFPIIMGIGIGASVPVMLSALGASVNGKRTAFVYLIIDVLGAAICGTLFYTINAFVHFDFIHMTMNMVTIALLNTLFRLACVIFLAPCIGLMEKIVCRIFPDDPETLAEQADMDRLEERFLAHPVLSIAQSRMVIESMAAKAGESVQDAVKVRREYSKEGIQKVYDLEDLLDRYEDKLGTYLAKVTAKGLNRRQSVEVSKYLRVLSDFERISDHARNIGEAVMEIEEKKIQFTGKAQKELTVLEDAVNEITRITIEAFIKNNVEEARKVDPLEEVIDFICDELKARHITRVSIGECSLDNGFVFNDLLTDYERIADHCSNVAVDIMETGKEIKSHEYHQIAESRRDEAYVKQLDAYNTRFAI
ncbi:MAG: Na/Pi cotransporter family protein [Eubacterium sp.]|nr:Na/Pi cotransporter family protein [Eubacterium sp.]